MEEGMRKELIGEMKSKHRDLMRWLISGSTIAEAAARTGISKENVTRLASSELFKSEMSIMQDELDKELHEKKVSTAIEIQEMNLQAAKDNLSVRIDIRDKEMESPASRLKACDAIDVVAGIKAPEGSGQTLTIAVDDGLKAALVDYATAVTGKVKEDKS